jgi:beta-lactamase regulating signal transducer with metallopeptidase domain
VSAEAVLAAAPDLVLRATLLIAGAWLAAFLLARSGASAAARNLLWTLALAALLALPLLFAALPGLPLLPAAPVTAAAGERAGAAPPATGLIWLYVYLAVAALLLGRLAVGRLALARLWARSMPAADPDFARAKAELQAAFGISRPVALRLGPGPVMPITWGSWRPKVLLPADSFGWSAARKRSVLAHELGHVARRDSFIQLAASVAAALYWFHPAIWFALRRLRIEQEHACDDLVLAGGTPAGAYARDLLDIAFRLRMPPLAGSASLAMARASQLERRLLAIVAARSRRRPGRAGAALWGTAALLTTIFVAAAVPATMPPEPVPPPPPGPAAAPAPPQAVSLAVPARPARRRVAARPAPRAAPIAVPSPPPVGATPALPPIPALRPVPPLPAVPPLPPVPEPPG